MERFALGGAFSLDLLDEREGLIVFKVSGKNARTTFANEAGGHRFQRVPPTEKRGRVQTSTITVVVLNPLEKTVIAIPESDLEWSVCKSGGAGGQHVNKTSSAVQVKHKPTGTKVRVESRSQHQNKVDALDLLQRKLLAVAKAEQYIARATERKNQAGSGERGDKIRTIRQQDNTVVDHKLNKRLTYKDYARGIWDELLDGSICG